MKSFSLSFASLKKEPRRRRLHHHERVFIIAYGKSFPPRRITAMEMEWIKAVVSTQTKRLLSTSCWLEPEIKELARLDCMLQSRKTLGLLQEKMTIYDIFKSLTILLVYLITIFNPIGFRVAHARGFMRRGVDFMTQLS